MIVCVFQSLCKYDSSVNLFDFIILQKLMPHYTINYHSMNLLVFAINAILLLHYEASDLKSGTLS